MIDMILYDCEGKWLLLACAIKVWGEISCRLDKKHQIIWLNLNIFRNENRCTSCLIMCVPAVLLVCLD